MNDDYGNIIRFAENRFLAENLIGQLKHSFKNVGDSKITNLLNKIDYNFYRSGGNDFETAIDEYDLEDENYMIYYNLDNLLSVQSDIKKLKILLKNSRNVTINQEQIDIIFNLENIIQEIISFVRNTL